MFSQSIFLTKVGSTAEKAAVKMLIESIHMFGGDMRSCPIWVFATNPQVETCKDLATSQVEVFLTPTPEHLSHYPFGDKVFACARAEAQTPVEINSLIWLDAEYLIIQPPSLFALEDAFDAAVRPVHHRNVGLSPDEELNDFWRGIYTAIGIRDVSLFVDSFIDHQCLRAYFNSHGFSLRPSLGLCRRWYEQFDQFIRDNQFQQTACLEKRHRIFLFQALLSTLIASSVDERRVRILPPTYNYPYNLHNRIEGSQRAVTLNELVSLTYEGRPIHPNAVTDIEIHEPLRAWLAARTTDH